MTLIDALKENGAAVLYSLLPFYVSGFDGGLSWCAVSGDPVLPLDEFELNSVCWFPRLPLHERMSEAYVKAFRLNQRRGARAGGTEGFKVLQGVRKYAHSQGQRARRSAGIPLFQNLDFAVSRRIPVIAGTDL